MLQVINAIEAVLVVLCILPVREHRVAPVQPRRKGWMLPSDAFRCVLGSADVVQPRPLAPVNASINRDGYDMDAIPALKATRKPRTVKPAPVQPVKVARKATPRKATQVAAQTVATDSPAYLADAYQCDGTDATAHVLAWVHSIDRRTLQGAAKVNGIPANKASDHIRNELALLCVSF